MSPSRALDHAVPTWAICIAGAAGLAVAMGIGRFVFTPLLPLMQREGLLSADGGALLAAANYLGYLLGALSAARVPASPRALVMGALLGTAALTAATGWLSGLPAWLTLRFAAGVVSAWALVGISSWAVPALAQRGRADAGGWVFAGVGLGIALAGGWVWLFAAQATPTLWLQLGAVALVLAVLVATQWRRGAAVLQRPSADRGSAAVPRGSWPLVLCYGTLGFGYILPATYLPALARELIDDPRLFGLVWPVFGLAAAASTLLAGRALRRWHRLRIWSASHALMAIGCALPLLTRSGPGLTLAALCVGGTFMVATMVGLQQARMLAPLNPTPLLGRMSAAFAAGQIAGPLVALGLARVPAPGWSGIELTLLLAVLSLLASAVWLHRSTPALETSDEHTALARTD
ncbi:YbfB/YjiJ family MFS transporter [Aquabacterium sp.]|uniref:YbfB/YjiJ family MFS transporter n=1 Tax=Aquabacterium sp. TaxID=1872578 RepID=UPI002B7FC864|nr:YbfB/YjiJ family MFS transporter [Aquabacterium sp.]HSW03726.1 YbfB/YjiJ family MFS transporter [Aquabacterium sp.]